MATGRGKRFFRPAVQAASAIVLTWGSYWLASRQEDVALNGGGRALWAGERHLVELLPEGGCLVGASQGEGVHRIAVRAPKIQRGRVIVRETLAAGKGVTFALAFHPELADAARSNGVWVEHVRGRTIRWRVNGREWRAGRKGAASEGPPLRPRAGEVTWLTEGKDQAVSAPSRESDAGGGPGFLRDTGVRRALWHLTAPLAALFGFRCISEILHRRQAVREQ